MKHQRTSIFLASTLFVAALLIDACAPIPSMTAVPTVMDAHGVEPILGTSKFNLLSLSNINRRFTTTTSHHLELVESGHSGNWQWDILAVPAVLPQVRSFDAPRAMSVGSGAAAHTVDIPSLDTAMREFRAFYQTIIGPGLLPLHLQLAIYPENVHVRVEKRQHSDSAIPMYFAYSIPEKASTDGDAAYTWLIDTLDGVAHEYWHSYVNESEDTKVINDLTTETTAYTLERCVQVALSNRQATFHLYDIGGAPIDVARLGNFTADLQRLIEKWGPTWGVSGTGRNLSGYNIAWILQTNVIKKDDVNAQEKLYGLCYAMVHHPVDLAKSFYPRDNVKLIPFSAPGAPVTFRQRP